MFGETYKDNGENAVDVHPSRYAHGSKDGKQVGAARSGLPAAVHMAAAHSAGRPGASAVANAHTGDARNVLRQDGDGESNDPAGPSVGGHRLKSVAQIIQELDEDHDVQGAKGGCCARFFIPYLAALLMIVILLATVWTSGSGVDVAATPRVAVLLIEGFRGDIFAEMVSHERHLPNIVELLGLRGGVHAQCPSVGSAKCARSVVVEDETSGSVYVYSGSSIASILSGVPPRLHGVSNDTLDAYANYATTSKAYPSLAKRVKDAGLGVTVVGTSRLLNSFGGTSGRCSQPGVLDMECAGSKRIIIAGSTDAYNGDAVTLECMSASSCNARTRKIKTPTNPDEYSDGHAETQFARQMKEIFGGLELTHPGQEGAEQNTIADNLDDSLFIFHFDALAVRTGSATLPDFEYSHSSPSYVAQAYLIDSMVGHVIAYVRDRAETQKENWLVLGVSDHGGYGKAFTESKSRETGAKTLEANQAIAFFMSTITTNAKKFVKLLPLGTATSQLDVVPTVLRWLNIAPFDEATEAATGGRNESYTEEIEANLEARKVFEGQVRGICSSGVNPADCV